MHSQIRSFSIPLTAYPTPESLRKDPNKVAWLRERLFLLWGELAERKDAFLKDNPEVKPDERFSTWTYNITAETVPFEALIAETGGVVQPNSEEYGADMGENLGWWRYFDIVGTKIRTD